MFVSLTAKKTKPLIFLVSYFAFPMLRIISLSCFRTTCACCRHNLW